VAKHLKLAPRGAQSESSAHGFEQAFTIASQPPSATVPTSAEQESPAPHSESALQAEPADFKAPLLQPTAEANAKEAMLATRRFMLHLAW
jgi:hypothetical protein